MSKENKALSRFLHRNGIVQTEDDYIVPKYIPLFRSQGMIINYRGHILCIYKNTLKCDYIKQDCVSDTLSIPEGIQHIGNCAFHDAQYQAFRLPSTLMSIGDHSFYKCKNITSLNVPDSIDSIGDKAFYGCEKLQTMYLPENIFYIGHMAFAHCTDLTVVRMPLLVRALAMDAFYGCTNLKYIYANPAAIEPINILLRTCGLRDVKVIAD